MSNRETPASYAALLRLLRITGETLAESLRRCVEESDQPFDLPTAHFEVDVYIAFRMSTCLQRNPRAWNDLAFLFMRGVVNAHRDSVSGDDLDRVFEERVEVYSRCWNACVDSRTYPALQCLKMLRMFMLSAARHRRVAARAPLDLSGGIMTEFGAVPALVEIDTAVVGTLDCMLKNIMRLSDDLARLSEVKVLTAAELGIEEAVSVLGDSPDILALRSRLLSAVEASRPRSDDGQPPRGRRWWQFWNN